MGDCQMVAQFSRCCQYFQLTKLNKGITCSVTDRDASVCALQFEIVCSPLTTPVSTIVFKTNRTLNCVCVYILRVSQFRSTTLTVSCVRTVTILFRYHIDGGLFCTTFLLIKQFPTECVVCSCMYLRHLNFWNSWSIFTKFRVGVIYLGTV